MYAGGLNLTKWQRDPRHDTGAGTAAPKEYKRYNNKEFGSVFRAARDFGPRTIDDNLPSWEDPMRPGNTQSNESAKEIMAKWPPDVRKRFRIFMDGFKDRNTYGPWVREWLEKSAPDYDKDREQIVKCKLELIKRLLHIKVRGPESMEDFCLLFLYQDHRLDIPADIESVLKPLSAEMNIRDHWADMPPGRDTVQWFTTPSDFNVYFPANMTFPGTLTGKIPSNPNQFDGYHPWYYRFSDKDADTNDWNEKTGMSRPSVKNSRTMAQAYEAVPDWQRQPFLRQSGYKPRTDSTVNARAVSKYPAPQ